MEDAIYMHAPVNVPKMIAQLIVRVAWGDGPHPTEEDWETVLKLPACRIGDWHTISWGLEHRYIAIIDWLINNSEDPGGALIGAAGWGHLHTVVWLLDMYDIGCNPKYRHGMMRMIRDGQN